MSWGSKALFLQVNPFKMTVYSAKSFFLLFYNYKIHIYIYIYIYIQIQKV